MTYAISQTEIQRRKKAYTTLSLSILVGLAASSIVFGFPIHIASYLVVLATLFSLGLFSFTFLHHLSAVKITISDTSLQREIDGVFQEFSLDAIRQVETKWTTNNTIRAMYIVFEDKKRVVLSAVHPFKSFKKDLLKRLNKNVVIKERHEPLDFDHPLFYSLLGLPISAIGVLLVKIAPLLTYQHLKIGGMAFVIYLLSFGSYFVGAKPLSRELGRKATGSDYAMGGLMICAGIILFFLVR